MSIAVNKMSLKDTSSTVSSDNLYPTSKKLCIILGPFSIAYSLIGLVKRNVLWIFCVTLVYGIVNFFCFLWLMTHWNSTGNLRRYFKPIYCCILIVTTSFAVLIGFFIITQKKPVEEVYHKLGKTIIASVVLVGTGINAIYFYIIARTYEKDFPNTFLNL